MEFEEQPNEQQCGNTCARVAKLPWLPRGRTGLSKGRLAPYPDRLSRGATSKETLAKVS